MSEVNLTRVVNVATSGSVVVWCFRCTIHFQYARGNQHQRTEHGSCSNCGKRFTREIKWGAVKNAQWWKAVAKTRRLAKHQARPVRWRPQH